MNLKVVSTLLVASLMAASCCAEEKKAEKAAAGKAPISEAAKPTVAEKAPAPAHKPKKAAEYKEWAKAAACAEAWKQPIIAFVELKGDKTSGKIRQSTVAQKEFALLVRDNFVYYHCTVPQLEVRRGRGRNQKGDQEPKPDYAAVAKSEQAMVKTLVDNSSLPVICVADATGKLLGTVVVADDAEKPFCELVEGIKNTLEGRSMSLTIPPKVQKAIDVETKKAEKSKAHK